VRFAERRDGHPLGGLPSPLLYRLLAGTRISTQILIGEPFAKDYNSAHVVASAPGSLGSMVLYSPSAVTTAEKMARRNAKYAYLATRFSARFFVRRKPRGTGVRPVAVRAGTGVPRFVATVGHAPQPARIRKSWAE
jgi:hypothetical protein